MKQKRGLERKRPHFRRDSSSAYVRFSADVRGAQVQLKSPQATTLRTNAAITGFGRGILGLAGGFLAFGSLSEILKESIALSKEEAGTMAALNSLITHNNALRGIGANVSKQQGEQIDKQAKSLQEQSGIYSGVYVKGAATLAMYKLTTTQIEGMQGGNSGAVGIPEANG